MGANPSRSLGTSQAREDSSEHKDTDNYNDDLPRPFFESRSPSQTDSGSMESDSGSMNIDYYGVPRYLTVLSRNQKLNEGFLSVFKDFKDEETLVLGMDNDWRFKDVELQTIKHLQIDIPHYLLQDFFFREFVRHKDRKSLCYDTLILKLPVVPVPKGTKTKLAELVSHVKFVVGHRSAADKVFAKMTYHFTRQDKYNDCFVTLMDDSFDSKGKLWHVSTSAEPRQPQHLHVPQRALFPLLPLRQRPQLLQRDRLPQFLLERYVHNAPLRVRGRGAAVIVGGVWVVGAYWGMKWVNEEEGGEEEGK
ncbi:hypothetical protein B7494_g7393 [Chlorociboria aeruginascens]|nr:hypothetical protein B7494_g7393 [Chlorociboria aeruginascens]